MRRMKLLKNYINKIIKSSTSTNLEETKTMKGNSDILKILQKLEQRINNFEKEMKNAINELKNEMSNLKEEMNNLKKEMNELKDEINNLKDEINSINRKIEDLKWGMELLNTTFRAIASASSVKTNNKNDEWIDMTLFPTKEPGFTNTRRTWKKLRW